MSEKTCFNINFDSLGSFLFEKNKDFSDPTFFQIADRFFELSNKYGFKYTIFVIGKDLEDTKIAQRVREWSKQGHEIGNHSYSHRLNLGHLAYGELEDEVVRSHEIISRICQKEPRGFIAPAWATSPDLIDILIKHNYLQDLPDACKDIRQIERLDIPKAKKIEMIYDFAELICKYSKKIVTLEQIANEIISERGQRR